MLLLLFPERGQCVNAGRCLFLGRESFYPAPWMDRLCAVGSAHHPGQQELITRALSQQRHLPPPSFQASMEFPRPKPFDACLRASGLSAFQEELSAEE